MLMTPATAALIGLIIGTVVSVTHLLMPTLVDSKPSRAEGKRQIVAECWSAIGRVIDRCPVTGVRVGTDTLPRGELKPIIVFVWQNGDKRVELVLRPDRDPLVTITVFADRITHPEVNASPDSITSALTDALTSIGLTVWEEIR